MSQRPQRKASHQVNPFRRETHQGFPPHRRRNSSKPSTSHDKRQQKNAGMIDVQCESHKQYPAPSSSYDTPLFYVGTIIHSSNHSLMEAFLPHRPLNHAHQPYAHHLLNHSTLYISSTRLVDTAFIHQCLPPKLTLISLHIKPLIRHVSDVPFLPLVSS